MSFKARLDHPKTGKLVDARDYHGPTIKMDLAGHKFYSPFPDVDMEMNLFSEHMILQGLGIRRAHFKHKRKDWKTEWSFTPESELHLGAKEWLSDYLRKEDFPDNPSIKIDIEYYGLTESKRVPDLAVVDERYGCFQAHEIQLSPISPDVYAQRTLDIKKDGDIDVYWWLDKKTYKKEVVLSILKAGGMRPRYVEWITETEFVSL